MFGKVVYYKKCWSFCLILIYGTVYVKSGYHKVYWWNHVFPVRHHLAQIIRIACNQGPVQQFMKFIIEILYFKYFLFLHGK